MNLPLHMKVKVESEKVGLKLNIQKANIMASGPITSWQIDGETVETVSFNFMAAVTTCNDFGAQKNSLPLFPHLFVMK